MNINYSKRYPARSGSKNGRKKKLFLGEEEIKDS